MLHKHIAYLLTLLLLSLSAFTHAQTRSPTQDIQFQSGNSSAYGTWSDGTTMWVVDSVANRIFAYNIANITDMDDMTEGVTRDETKEFDLDPSNGLPQGIWSDGDTMWVVDMTFADSTGRRRIFAYDISDIDNGNVSRDADKDIALALATDAIPGGRPAIPANAFPQGIWSDGETMWVADFNADRIFAYDISDITNVRPDSDKNISLVAKNGDARGIWGKTTGTRTTLWVADNIESRIFAYDISDIDNGNVSHDENSEFDLETSNANFEENNQGAQGIWSDGTTLWVVDVFGDHIFTYTLVGGARDTDSEFDLFVANDNPRGIWSNGETLWVADSTADHIFAYTLNTGMRDTRRDINLATDNANPTDIWSDGDTMWVADITFADSTGRRRVFAYDISDIDNGNVSRDADKDIALALATDAIPGGRPAMPANAFPQGIWSDGTTLWVADSLFRNTFMYAYTLRTGMPDNSREFNFSVGNDDPRGIWSDGLNMWVSVDTGINNNRVELYNRSTGMRNTSRRLTLAGANDEPRGIWGKITGTRTTLWVADQDDGRAYAYTLPTIPVITPVSLVGVSLAEIPEEPIIIPTMDGGDGNRILVPLEYMFRSNETGRIDYIGSCTSASLSDDVLDPNIFDSAIVGTNTVTFAPLEDGTYTDCVIAINTAINEASNQLAIPAFTVDTTAPELVAPIGTQTVAVGSQVTLTATVRDRAAATLSYAWSQVVAPGSPTVALTTGTGTVELTTDTGTVTTTFTAPGTVGDLVFDFTVTDDAGNEPTGDSSVTIEVRELSVDAGDAQIVAGGADPVRLTATPMNLTNPMYSWSLSSSTPVTPVTLNTTTGSMTTFTAPTPAPDNNIILEFEVTATSETAAGGTEEFTDTVTVTVDGTAPTVTITPPDPATANGDFMVDIEFSEPVTGFIESDITLDNGTLMPGSLMGSGSSYTATITPTGFPSDGVMIITITIPAGAAVDSVGNQNAVGELMFNFELDTMDPQITGITRMTTPAGLNGETNEDTLTWSVVFDDDVNNVGTDDFMLTSVPEPGEALDINNVTLTVTPVSDANYEVTLSGGGLDEFDGTVHLSIAEGVGGNDITDSASNSLVLLADSTPTPTIESYMVDNTAPEVMDITRLITPVGPNGETNANELTWQLVFREPVTIGDTGFSLAGTDAMLSAVASDDTGTIYQVTASGGDLATANGAVTLSIDAGTSITDRAGNRPAAQDFSDHSYTLDNIPPTVTITAPDRTTAAFTVNIKFSEVVTGFAREDIMVVNGMDGMASSLMGSGSSYRATITPDTSLEDGDMITINIAAVATRDLAGNGNEIADQVTVLFTLVDNIAPEIQDISRSGMPPLAEVTNSGTLTWEVVFNEAVNNVDMGDFMLMTSSISGEALDDTVMLEIVDGSDGDTSYQVMASGGGLDEFDGEVSLSIVLALAPADRIADIAGNELTVLTPNDDNDSYTLDNTAPTVESIRRFDPSDEIINSGTLTWELTFIEPVTTGTNGFSLAGTNDATLLSAVASDDTGTTYRVTASGGNLAELDATVTLSIDAETSSITDRAGNSPATQDFSDHSYTLDNTAPNITEVTAIATLTNDATPEYIFRSTEAGTITYDGACTMPTMPTAMAVTELSDTIYTVTFNELAEDTYTNYCTITVTDAASNTSNTLAVGTFTIDTTKPRVATITAEAGSYGIGQTVAIQVIFTEPVVVTGSGTLALSLNNGGQAIYSREESGSSTLTFNYTVSAGEGIASLDILNDDALSLAGTSISDPSGNPATPSLAGTTTEGLNDIRISTPGVIGVSGADGHYQAGDEVIIRVQFSESVTISGGTALQLQLETGDIDRVATFSELTTTNIEIPNDTLDFIYRVEEGDRSRDLAYTSPNALVETDGTRVTGVASGLGDTDLRADSGANLIALLSLPALDAPNSLAGSSDIVVGVLIEEQNARLNEMLLPKIVQAMSTATVDAITRRIESGGGDRTASLSSGLSSGISDILPSGLASLKDLDLSELLSDLSWLKSFAYDFLMDKAEQSARSGSIGLDALGSGFDIKGMLGGFDIKRILGNSEFVMPLNVSGAGGTGSGATSSMVLWGSGNYSNLSDNDNGLDYDGDIYSINLGIDSQISRETLLGISVNWSNSDFDYRDATTVQTGDYGYKLYGINPYISWSPQGLGGGNLWATFGYGIGEIENQIEGVEKVETDTRQYQFSGGGRYILTSSADSLSQLSIKGDLTLLRVDIEQSAGFLASDIDSQSFRLLLQGSSVFNYAGYSFTPSLEGGLRYDLGDGDTGGGIELSPAFTYKSLDDHILIEGRGRYLVAGQYDQWGLSVLARIDQARHGRGLSFSMHPTWGQSQAQAEQLTAHNGSRFNDYRAAKAEAQIKTELSYGMRSSHILGQTMLFTPYAEFTLGENARYYQFGQRLSIGELLSLSFKLSHHQRRGYADDNHLGLESTINF